MLKKSVREFSDDQCTDLAATLTYYAVLSLFPALLAIVSVLGLTGQRAKTTDALLGIVDDLRPASAVDTFRPVVESLAQNQAAGIAALAGLLVALWSASGYVGAFSQRRRLRARDQRPVAEAVGRALGLGTAVVSVWQVAKWPVLVALVVVIIAILYYATPNVQQPKFRWMSVGAFITLIVWAVASALFGFYVANFGNYNKTYGALAGVVVFLLWLWITNLALLFGAEFDSEMERGRELQAGLPAEEQLQLPARDTRKIEKSEAKEAEELAEARRLRSTRGRSSK